MRKKRFFIILCLLFVTLSPSYASRYSPPFLSCYSKQALILGSIEMYEMDNTKLYKDLFPGKFTEIKFDFYQRLIEGKYISRIADFEEIKKKHGCKLYFLNFEKEIQIICSKHGSSSIHRKEKTISSPYHHLERLCADNNEKIRDFRFKVSKDDYSDISGPKVLRTVTNAWPVFLIIPIFIFMRSYKRLKGIGFFAKTYIFYSEIAATMCILTSINIMYIGSALPSWRRFTYGSYPGGAVLLATISLYAIFIFWISSILAVFLFRLKKLSVFFPLIGIFVTPIIVIAVEMPMMQFLSFLVPIYGFALLYLLNTITAPD